MKWLENKLQKMKHENIVFLAITIAFGISMIILITMLIIL